MIRRVVNQLLKAALSELFITSSTDTVQMSVGSDMFSSSNVHLKDLTVRPDIFDACLHPLKLVSGHFGILKVEGIAEAAMGAPIKVYVENIFLLFTLSECEDAEHIQVLRKILLELISNTITHTMVTHLLRKVLGMANDKSSDSSKQRKIIYLAMKHVFKIIQVSVKKIHIRLEFDPTGGRGGRSANDIGTGYSALGMTLPSVKIAQNLKLAGISEEIVSVVGEESDPSISLQLKALQVYCDYDIDPYLNPATKNPSQQRSEILKRFADGWATEVHTAILLPFDLEVFTQISLDVISGNLAPKLTVAIPRLRVAFDPRQLEVFKDLVESIANLIKRAVNLCKLVGIFNDIKPPPRIRHEKGLHILPHLLIGKENLHFPSAISVPRNLSTGVKDLLQQRSAADADMGGWARHMWRHAVEMILRDLRPLLPLGRWKNLILLCWARKEYVFTYGKYLRHVAMLNSKSKGPSPLSPADVIRLHEFEMSYPISTILQFREVAVAVFNAQELFLKRKKAKSGKQYTQRNFSKALSWRDVLSILTILKEEQRGVISYVSPVVSSGGSGKGAGEGEVGEGKARRGNEGVGRARNESLDGSEGLSSRVIGKVTDSNLSQDGDSPSPLTAAVLEAVAKEGLASSDRAATSDEGGDVDADESALTSAPLSPVQLDEGEKGNNTEAIQAIGRISTPDPASVISPSASSTPPLKQSMAQNAAKLFSNRRMSTGTSTPDSHTTGTPEGAKGSASKPAGRASVGSAARKTTLLNTMSAALGGSKGSGSKKSAHADETSAGGQTMGESRFNTLLARTLHSSDSREDFDVGLLGNYSSEDSDDDSVAATTLHVDEPDVSSNNIVHDYASVVDAVRWVIRMHQSPVSVLLPNARLELGAIEVSLRLPKENGARRLIVSVEILQTSALVSASSTAGNSATSEAIKLLTGLLVIIKASIQSISIKLHCPRRRSTAHPEGGEVATPLLTSKPSETFLHACVIVDVPPGATSNDKAVDLQINLGSLDLNLKKGGFSIFVEPRVRANLSRVLYCMTRIKLHLAVLADKSVVVERHVDCLGVPSVLLRNIHNSAGGEGLHGVATAQARMDLHKKSVTAYLNSKRFYDIFSMVMPKGVVTLGVHTGTISADLLSSTSLRTFAIIWMRDMTERALSDPNASSSLFSRSTLNAYLKAATRRAAKSTLTSQRMSNYLHKNAAGKPLSPNVAADIDPVNIDIKKTPDPFPLISVSAPGIALTVPVDDDTLCRLLSLMLGGLLPFYIIRAVPMPMQVFEDAESDVDEEMELSEDEEGVGSRLAEVSVEAVLKSEKRRQSALVERERVDNSSVRKTEAAVGALPTDDGAVPTEEVQGGEGQAVMEAGPPDGKLTESKLPIASSPSGTFRRCDFSSFMLTSSVNMFKKEQKPSGRPLYVPVAAYAYSVSNYLEHIANMVPMPPEVASEDVSLLRGGAHIPPVLVVQIHMPHEQTSVLQHMQMPMQRKRDTTGVSLVVYFSLAKSVRQELQKLSTASAPVRLFNEWSKHAYKDQSWQGRMKLIPSVLQVDQGGSASVPPALQPYNNKAVHLTRTGTVHKGPNYIEIDINTNALNALGGLGGLSGSRGAQAMFDHIADLYTQVGFAVEGRTDDELPEVLCACVGLNKVDSSKVVSI